MLRKQKMNNWMIKLMGYTEINDKLCWWIIESMLLPKTENIPILAKELFVKNYTVDRQSGPAHKPCTWRDWEGKTALWSQPGLHRKNPMSRWKTNVLQTDYILKHSEAKAHDVNLIFRGWGRGITTESMKGRESKKYINKWRDSRVYKTKLFS